MSVTDRALGCYIHVPFCSTRCGYCDFNTYTASELVADGVTVSRTTYAARAMAELELMRRAYADDPRPISTVFVGGGTPTLLEAHDLVAMLERIRDLWGLAPGAEVTTEANPDSVTPDMLAVLREGGFTRISLGHQSSASHVLAVLDRTHTPGRSLDAVREARMAGFAHVNLDLIYNTPGESEDDLRRTLDDVLSVDVDHVSAYSLIVEPGTRLAAQVQRGDVPMPDEDVAAERYELIDDALTSAGLCWYEVSNWARSGSECRHNLAYWRGDDWFGIGPGAHAHYGNRRWVNVKHPAAYAARIDAGESPEHEHEVLDAATQRTETIMLGLRLRDGLPAKVLDDQGRAAADDMCAEGVIEPGAWADGRLVLTRQGRLVADGLVRRLLG